VIVEAFYNKLPVLSTRIPVTDEVVAGGKYGVLFNPHKIDDIVSEIEKIVNDEYNLNIVKEEAYKFALSLSPENYVKERYEIFDNI